MDCFFILTGASSSVAPSNSLSLFSSSSFILSFFVISALLAFAFSTAADASSSETLLDFSLSSSKMLCFVEMCLKD